MYSQSSTRDCNIYDNFSKKIINSDDSNEVKLEKLYDFSSDKNIQCANFSYDVSLLRRKIFSYLQNDMSITPHFLSSCNVIVNGDVCDFEQHDWSEGVYFRYNNSHEEHLINRDAKIPLTANGYNLHSIYYHWNEKSDGEINRTHKKRLHIEKHDDFASITSEDLIKKNIVPGSSLKNQYYSQMWLSIIYKKNNSDFIKVVWYY